MGMPLGVVIAKSSLQSMTAYNDLDASEDLAAAAEATPDAKICAGGGSKDSELHTAFEAAAEHYRGKALFIWSPEGSDRITLYRHGRDPVTCDDSTACITADGLIGWLD